MDKSLVMQCANKVMQSYYCMFCMKFSSVTYAGDAQNYSWDSLTGEVRAEYVMIMELMLIIITCVFFDR